MSSIHHDVTTPGPPQLQEVDDGVYAYIQPDGTWWINNTGFLVANKGVVSIDACATERRTTNALPQTRPHAIRALKKPNNAASLT